MHIYIYGTLKFTYIYRRNPSWIGKYSVRPIDRSWVFVEVGPTGEFSRVNFEGLMIIYHIWNSQQQVLNG